MKRLPVILSFILFLALCASAAYWALQLIRPPLRPMAAPAPVAVAEARLDTAASLFGGRPVAQAAASNYQLKGVVVAANGRESVAILSADGRPAQAVGVNVELLPGVSVKEVHSQYVLISEGGIVKRVPLPEVSKAAQQTDFTTGALPPLASPPPPGLMRPPPQMPAPIINQVPPPQVPQQFQTQQSQQQQIQQQQIQQQQIQQQQPMTPGSVPNGVQPLPQNIAPQPAPGGTQLR